jgi:hypothetical protein
LDVWRYLIVKENENKLGNQHSQAEERVQDVEALSEGLVPLYLLSGVQPILHEHGKPAFVVFHLHFDFDILLEQLVPVIVHDVDQVVKEQTDDEVEAVVEELEKVKHTQQVMLLGRLVLGVDCQSKPPEVDQEDEVIQGGG